MSRYKTCPECGELAYCMTLLSDPPQEQWQCIVCGWKSEPVCLYVNQENPDVSTSAHCADCGMEYGTFPDMILPDDVWARIAPNEGGNGILCPTCIAKRLDKIGLWYRDGYYTHKGWSAFNPLTEQVESLQAELFALRADIEAGRLVRVPAPVGSKIYYLEKEWVSYNEYKYVVRHYEIYGWLLEDRPLELTDAATPYETYEGWSRITDGPAFLTREEAEQAARAAKEEGNENSSLQTPS